MTPRHALSSSILALLLVGATACGGSDSSDADDVSESGSGDVAAPAEEPADVPAESDGPGTATLTLTDGTVYSFEMTTCDTSDTDPSTFLVDPGFDAFGRSAEGFTLQLIRAAFEESPELQPTIGFEGGYDENGVNPETSYIRDGDATLEVDGGRIFGTATLRDFFSINPVQGDGFTADIDVNC